MNKPVPASVPAPKGPFVTVFQDLELTRMQVARSMLEASGLFCRLADEVMGGIFPRGPAVIARLQVPESQARLAKEILEGMNR